MSDIESDKIDPRATILFKISKELNVNIEDLLPARAGDITVSQDNKVALIGHYNSGDFTIHPTSLAAVEREHYEARLAAKDEHIADLRKQLADKDTIISQLHKI